MLERKHIPKQMSSAVNEDDFAGDKRAFGEKQNRPRDVVGFAVHPERDSVRQGIKIGFRLSRGRENKAGRHAVDADAGCEFQGAHLGERGQQVF